MRARQRGWALVGLLVGPAALVTLLEACAGTPPCEKNTDCAEGYCLLGECREECIDSEIDCPRGYVCNQVRQCEREIDGSGGAGTGGDASGGAVTSSAGEGGTGAASSSAGGAPMTSNGVTSSSSSVSTTTSTSGSGGGTAKGQLEVCASDSECTSGFCRAVKPAGTMRCTVACASDAQCPVGQRCVDKGGGGLCYDSDVGASCNAASNCNFACLQPQNYCTATCGSGADCPNGYGCTPVGSPAVNVCVKLEAICDQVDASACIAAAACDLSPSLIVGSCTTACNTAADCPQRAAPLAPWTCDGLCRRPADVYGPLPGGYQPTEWYCDASSNPIVLCNDAQHIDFVNFTIPPPPAVNCLSQFTTTGAANDACVNSCRFQGACTDGFACVAVGGVGNERIGLCMPRGAKEPGVSCTSDVECAFGYCHNGLCSRDCTLDGICPGGMTCVAAGGPAVEGMPFRRCQ